MPHTLAFGVKMEASGPGLVATAANSLVCVVYVLQVLALGGGTWLLVNGREQGSCLCKQWRGEEMCHQHACLLPVQWLIYAPDIAQFIGSTRLAAWAAVPGWFPCMGSVYFSKHLAGVQAEGRLRVAHC